MPHECGAAANAPRVAQGAGDLLGCKRHEGDRGKAASALVAEGAIRGNTQHTVRPSGRAGDRHIAMLLGCARLHLKLRKRSKAVTGGRVQPHGSAVSDR